MRDRKTPEEKFWIWFEKHQDMLFNFENDQENIFNQQSMRMNEVDPELTFEFGPMQNGKREFVISADGIKTSFHKVESLYKAAPRLSRAY